MRFSTRITTSRDACLFCDDACPHDHYWVIPTCKAAKCACGKKFGTIDDLFTHIDRLTYDEKREHAALVSLGCRVIM